MFATISPLLVIYDNTIKASINLQKLTKLNHLHLFGCLPSSNPPRSYFPLFDLLFLCSHIVGHCNKGPLITGENPLSRKIIKHKRTRHEPQKHAPCGRGPKWKGPRLKEATTAHQTIGRGTPRAILRLARGPDTPSGESPLHSRA
jgi:hypothetical protein